MKNSLCPSLPRAALAILLFSTMTTMAKVDPASAQGALTWSEYRALLDNALGPIDPSVYQPSVGTPWLSGLNLDLILAAVGDPGVPPSVFTDAYEILAEDPFQRRFIKIDFLSGRIRWANWQRRFVLGSSPEFAVPLAQARQAALTIAQQIGIPSNELDSITVDTIAGQVSDSLQVGVPFERERLVTIKRTYNGVPVYESMLRLALANTGQPARLLVQWPNFRTPPSMVARTRDAVLDEGADRLWNQFNGDVVELSATVAYAPRGSDYLPAALIAVADSLRGVVVPVALVAGPPDRDWDGVPDNVDLCVTRFTYRQLDEDGDGVGDECDNCPDAVNPDQQDVDNDGVGDACESAEGVCMLSGGDCETVSAGLCSAFGGIYGGDGTTCIPSDPTSASVAPKRLPLVTVVPNPFNPATEILLTLDVGHTGSVEVTIFDGRGRVVRNILSSVLSETGTHRLTWNGCDDTGAPVSSGVYFVRVHTPGGVVVQKMGLIR